MGPRAQSSFHYAFLDDTSQSQGSQTNTTSHTVPNADTYPCSALFPDLHTTGCLFRSQFKYNLLLSIPSKWYHTHSFPLLCITLYYSCLQLNNLLIYCPPLLQHCIQRYTQRNEEREGGRKEGIGEGGSQLLYLEGIKRLL